MKQHKSYTNVPTVTVFKGSQQLKRPGRSPRPVPAQQTWGPFRRVLGPGTPSGCRTMWRRAACHGRGRAAVKNNAGKGAHLLNLAMRLVKYTANPPQATSREVKLRPPRRGLLSGGQLLLEMVQLGQQLRDSGRCGPGPHASAGADLPCRSGLGRRCAGLGETPTRGTPELSRLEGISSIKREGCLQSITTSELSLKLCHAGAEPASLFLSVKSCSMA
jgi:hypothetical protein